MLNFLLSPQELGLAQAQLFPLRKDNARLLRENNELHRDAIAAQESVETRLRSHQVRSAHSDNFYAY